VPHAGRTVHRLATPAARHYRPLRGILFVSFVSFVSFVFLGGSGLTPGLATDARRDLARRGR
jgi:hypothetical protein